ncbi:MAG: condensation domain-containing protein [Pseudomonadota bacterium]
MNQSNKTQIEEIISDIGKQNINIWLQGDELRVGGDRDSLHEDVLNRLRLHKAELIEYLKSKDAEQQALSFAQYRLWFLQQLPHEAGVYNVPLAIKIEGKLDTEAVKKSMYQVVHRHQILRTRYPDTDGQAQLQVLSESELTIRETDLSTSARQAQQLNTYLRESAAHILRPRKSSVCG